MNYKILGIVLASVLLIGVATAAIAAYVSNTAILGFGVTQGVEVQNYDTVAGWTTADVALAGVTVGSTQTFYTRVNNKANNALSKPFTFVVSNSINDVTCADFDSIWVGDCETDSTCSTPAGLLWIDLATGCTDNGDGTSTFSFTTSNAANTIRAYTIKPTFNFAVEPADYTIAATVMA